MNEEIDIPIKYRMRFSLIAWNGNNDFKRETYTTAEYSNIKPIEARTAVFSEFDAIIKQLSDNERLRKKNGNYIITQPYEAALDLNKINTNIDISNKPKDFLGFIPYEKYQEELFIELLIDKNIALALGYDYKSTIIIHRVSSLEFEEQDLLDDLTTEYDIYETLKLDTNELEKEVTYYGVDYGESGENEVAAHNIILETPFVWNEKKPEPESKNLTHEDVINMGESELVEFKPSLIYDFGSNEYNSYIAYHEIARTICAFLNNKGGLLYIGIKNNNDCGGLEYDYSLNNGRNSNRDFFQQEFFKMKQRNFDKSVFSLFEGNFIRFNNKDVFFVEVNKSEEPVFIKRNKFYEYDMRKIEIKEFYRRDGTSSHIIEDVEEIIKHLKNFWRQK